ncbi:glycosyltransferase family 2 protein [Methylotuvimicrobium buryatense]|uniref:Glycosyltransferase n=1 Tax=Methylotuvimicrobium buryatense TaxID=95641 RepID=A0A4P9UN72_METBY|nr:glycosyltransferase family 2 protein [Methylotuvimicrobium buryatense]QCW81990.1 glycosyltransferase [Methylotuvimicrobium buryatense]
MPNELEKSIEVIICTHNRFQLLQRTIDFINNTKKPNNFSVSLFVVANACTDNTHQFLELYKHKNDPNSFPLRWVEVPKPGKSNALNHALPLLKSNIIAMIDDDHRVDDNYFLAIETALQNHPDADFFCGKILPDWDGSEPEWVHDQGKYRIYPLPVPRFDLGEQSILVTRDIAVPGGGNLVIKKPLFAQVGNFSNEFGPIGHNLGGAEDIEWVLRAFQTGARLVYLPDLIQYHYVDTARLTLLYLVKKAYERSASTVRLDEKAQNFTGLFPLYLIRKIMTYLGHALFNVNRAKRRFFLVRFAAALGEIKGFLMAKKR